MRRKSPKTGPESRRAGFRPRPPLGGFLGRSTASLLVPPLLKGGEREIETGAPQQLSGSKWFPTTKVAQGLSDSRETDITRPYPDRGGRSVDPGQLGGCAATVVCSSLASSSRRQHGEQGLGTKTGSAQRARLPGEARRDMGGKAVNLADGRRRRRVCCKHQGCIRLFYERALARAPAS